MHPTNTIDRAQPSGSALLLPGLILCFFLSGFAALLYQTAWLRQFSAVFGTSELAVAAVLAAYMGGLAAGAAVAGRMAVHVRRPVLAYGLLEAGIAISALSVPLLLLAARSLYAAALGDQPSPPNAATIGQPIFYLLVAFVVLALPTGFMGATLPLLTRHAVRSDAEVGPKVALLYATNTAGAVLGTVVSAFLLLPALGLAKTVWVGVAVNALVFAAAAALARIARVDAADRVAGEVAVRVPAGFASRCLAPLLDRSRTFAARCREIFDAQPGWILPLMLVSGANAFFYEVLWTRMLAHVMGGSIYAFATMLAAFLTGIALGGGLAGKVATSRAQAALAFVVTQLAIAGLSVGVYRWMGPLIPSVHTSASLALYAIAVLLPATLFIGATFPLAVRILANDEAEASPATARIYAWNTAGAIAGAVLAGFVVIPALGFEGSIRIAVAINVLLSLWTALFVAQRQAAFAGVCVIGLAIVAFFYQPPRPQAVISSSGFALDYASEPTEVFYSVGRSATVMVLEADGSYFLRTNGLPEARITARGGVPAQDAEKWLTALPVVARPDARSMLVVGFGGGVALEGVPPSVEDVDVVELEPEVIDANRALVKKRRHDPLADPRMHVVLNDARNALRLTSKTYDVIVSQPSHPWTAGASHLFTREFIAESKAHLSPGGAFVQWISADFLDAALLRTLAATVSAEFEHVRLYRPAPGALMFVASNAPLDIELDLVRSGRPLATDTLHYSDLGINGVEDLLAALALDETGLAALGADAPISTDDDNRMATRSRVHADGLTLADLTTLFAPNDPLLNLQGWVYAQLAGEIELDYLARRLLRSGQLERAASLAQALPVGASRHLVEGVLYRSTGQAEQARRAFAAAHEADPDDAQAGYYLLEDRLAGIGRDETAADPEDIAARLPASAAAVAKGWGYLATGDWSAIASLDATLAASRITDAWYPTATWLRAAWRTNSTENQPQLAREALELLDRTLVFAAEPRLYSLRAVSSMVAGDADYIVESLRLVVASIRVRLNSGLAVPAQELAATRQSLATMAQQIRSAAATADPTRAAAVLREIDNLTRLLDQSPGA